MGGIPVKVARSGYSGEKWGYEIYIAPDKKDSAEKALAAKAPEFDAIQVTELDVMAYTLATEKGFVLITDICDCTPFEVGMDKTIDWSKEFTGKAALEAVKNQIPPRQLISFTVDDPEARVYGGPKGAPIFKDGKKIGKATKYTFGPTVGKGVGFALIETGSAQIGDKVVINNDVEAVLAARPIL